jgi:Ca-activated chloride channel family protein
LQIILTALLVLLPSVSRAGGILHVFPPKLHGRAFAVARPTILLSRTLVTVSDSSTEYRIDQTFYNDNEFSLEGVFMLPVRAKEAVAGLRVRVDGIETKGEIVSWLNFFPTLKKLTTEMRDPSLLGTAGRDLLVVRPVTIGARRQKSFRISYVEPREDNRDHLDLLIPLDGERYSLGPVGEMEVRVRLKVSQPVRSIFSPSHRLSVFRESPTRRFITARIFRERVRDDFRLLTTFSGHGLDLRLFTHRTAGRKGAFMGLLSPPFLPPRERAADKDLVFILDASGSMRGTRERIGKRALTFCIEKLRPGDRFNILTLGTRIRKMAETLLPATVHNVQRAVEFLDATEPKGGTDLYNGLMDGLELLRSRRRPSVIVLVTDGRGTVGVTDPERITEDIRRGNTVGARIFALAVGKQPQAAILEKLATATKGVAWHVPPGADLNGFMNRFFEGVSPPALRNVSLKFKGIATERIEPDPIPDLFGRQGPAILGRYDVKSDVSAQVQLTAKRNKRSLRVVRQVIFPVTNPDHPFIPALWAMRRLADLLEREWAAGKNERFRRLIRRLARRYGFREPEPLAAAGRSGRAGNERSHAGSIFWLLKKSNVIADVRSDAYRHARGRAFRRADGRWTDTLYRSYMPTVHIDFLGENYFSLLKQYPEMGACLAIGPQVTLVWGSTAIAVTAKPVEGKPQARSEARKPITH